jgi:hypothetical protein
MNNLKVTPKDFFLWLGAMVALYVSVFSLITLYFSYIDKFFPDALYPWVDPYSGSIRFTMASLLVLFPAFLFLMRLIRKDITQIPEKKDLWVRRWVLFLTLFIAGVTIAIDLITLINYFLGGDLTTRFLLKVVVVLVVMSAAFWYFLSELRGRWNAQTGISQMLGYSAGVIVLASVVSGFFIIGSPMELRDLRFDEQRLRDLQDIQWQVVNYWQQHEELPSNLEVLVSPLTGYVVPLDPETQVMYEYVPRGAMTFEICAVFNRQTDPTSDNEYIYKPYSGVGPGVTESWAHTAGRTCFDRTIDPETFPPYRTMTN